MIEDDDNLNYDDYDYDTLDWIGYLTTSTFSFFCNACALRPYSPFARYNV